MDQPQAPNPVPTTLVPPPTFVPPGAPIVPPPPPPQAPRSLGLGRLFFPAAIIAVCIAGGAVAYAYVKNIGPFAHVPYTESNLISGLLMSAANISQATYSATGSLAVNPREEDAYPFVPTPLSEEVKAQYKRDAVRSNDYSSITSALRILLYGDKPLPATLGGLTQNQYNPFSTVDPLGRAYTYRVTENGQNYELTMVFETDQAIQAINRRLQRSSAEEMPTTINGKTVTFTRDSYGIYLSEDPPKPFLVELAEGLRMVPGDMSASLGVQATSDFSAEMPEWKFNFDATADFGDLAFKINADALKKGDTYYVRVNNMPSLLGAMFASVKGQWIKIDPAAASSTGYNSFSYLTRNIPEMEEGYKENRAELTAFLRKAATIADEVQLLTFKNTPRAESVDGRTLYRYDLEMRKEAIVEFYEKLVAEANQNKSTAYAELFNDPGMVEYLKSKEFSEMYDYYNANSAYTIWVDPQGYPAKVQNNIRIVPPDTAVALKDKQLNLVWDMTISDINRPVNIEAPADAKSIEELSDEAERNEDYTNYDW